MSGVDISQESVKLLNERMCGKINGGRTIFAEDVAKMLDTIRALSARIAELEAKLATARKDALIDAIYAVAQTSSTIQGTPYTAGPRKFCDAIRAIIEKETK